MKSDTGNLTVFPVPVKEKTKKEIAFEQSMGYLAETMGELFLVEKMTGRAGLPQRVYLAFSETIQSAIRLAEAQCGKTD